ncbi:SGNH/GDSL hydrolase family protein [Actinoplanes sp. N902-109]|uniref:SGNH/GDSL hydrolase family protein n=1 Tax=Actinoplanes sp. (strain N902-109) TaxID=649831 RepID=UPI0003294839|nr:SGNH/GDSL hydrolase family protein [Actinoplanes sp. N902-109]AGL16792.1 secreted protein [Actinoplanes sp. N902-109]
MPDRRSVVAAVLAAVVGASVTGVEPAVARPAGAWTGAWTGAWSTSPQREAGPGLQDRTLRMLVHPTLGGSAVRLRLANTFGERDVTFDGVGVARAVAAGSAEPAAGTVRPVTFHGRPAVTVAAGTQVLSDPVPLGVAYGQDLAVDLHVADGGDAAVVTGHDAAQGTQFVAEGDQVGAGAAAFAGTLTSWFWLAGVDVRPAAGVRGSIVALGDSITDGAYTTWNGNDRWTDDLAARLQALPARRRLGVLNQGIGGNQVLTDRTDCCGGGTSIAALRRERADVRLQTGVRYLILADGINDIGYGASADALITGLATIAGRARAAGIRVIGATITPYGCAEGCFTAAQEAVRQRVNAWIRTTRAVDGVADFDAAVRDPLDPGRVLPAYQADHLHPNVAGQRAMAAAIDLGLFRA